MILFCLYRLAKIRRFWILNRLNSSEKPWWQRWRWISLKTCIKPVMRRNSIKDSRMTRKVVTMTTSTHKLSKSLEHWFKLTKASTVWLENACCLGNCNQDFSETIQLQLSHALRLQTQHWLHKRISITSHWSKVTEGGSPRKASLITVSIRSKKN